MLENKFQEHARRWLKTAENILECFTARPSFDSRTVIIKKAAADFGRINIKQQQKNDETKVRSYTVKPQREKERLQKTGWIIG